MRHSVWFVSLILVPVGLSILALRPVLYPDGDQAIPPGHAGGPVIGEFGGQTCSASGCHLTGDVAPTAGKLTVPASYVPGGEPLRFVVEGVRGMQVTVTNAAGTAHVGTLYEGGGLAYAQGNENYLTHDEALGEPGAFTVAWQPPSGAVGPVHVYVAGSNGFVSETWTASATISEAETNQAPTVVIVEGPPAVLTERRAFFSWTGSDPDGEVSNYHVSLSGASPAAITTLDNEHEFIGLSDGFYTFTVRAVDDDGASSPSATWDFEVRAPNVAPTVEIVSGPAGTIHSAFAGFQWRGLDEDGAIASYEIALTGPTSSSFTTVATFHQFEALADGAYRFEVRAIDDDDAVSAWARREFVVAVNPVNTEDADTDALTFEMEALYPNPFNPSATFVIVTARPGQYVLQVFDLQGRLVLDESLWLGSPGRTAIDLDLDGRPGGLYIVRAVETATGRQVSARATLLK